METIEDNKDNFPDLIRRIDESSCLDLMKEQHQYLERHLIRLEQLTERIKLMKEN